MRDATQLTGLYDCQRFPFGDDEPLAESDALDPQDGGTQVIAAPIRTVNDPLVANVAIEPTDSPGDLPPLALQDDNNAGLWLAGAGIIFAVVLGLAFAVSMRRRVN